MQDMFVPSLIEIGYALKDYFQCTKFNVENSFPSCVPQLDPWGP
jgi:hypothetical protein